MSMNLRKSMKRSFGEGDASKKAAEEKKMSKILQKFEASCSIFNPPSEAVEDLKEKFIEFSLKEESMKEEKPWAVMNHRINKAQELLTKLRKDHPDTIHDCLFGCNEKEFYLADMNVGDLCYIVHKSLAELTRRIKYREENGGFADHPPHYDTRKGAAGADAGGSAEAGAAVDEADERVEDNGLSPFYNMLLKRYFNKDFLYNKDTKKAISSLNHGNHQASTSDPATTDDVPAVTVPTAADDVLE